MRIWHQSLTVIEDLPAYADRMRAHIATVARPDTEVVLHGLLPGTYPATYPGDDIAYSFLFAMHSLQWPVHALSPTEYPVPNGIQPCLGVPVHQ